MGHKQSKTKREGSNTDVAGLGGSQKLKKKSSVKRRLTKAFSSKKDVKQKQDDNTYAATRQATMKRTNTTGAITPPGLREAHVNVSAMHTTGSITPITSTPRKTTGAGAPMVRADTLSTPHTYENHEEPRRELKVFVNDEGKVVIIDGDDVIQVDSVGQTPQEEEDKPATRPRAASHSSSFLKLGSASTAGSRPLALPTNRMSKAYDFHQQIAAKEKGERGAELQRILLAEKPICDAFEDNPFKKGICRLCKHPKSVHKDPYSDIMDDLADC